MAGTIAHRDGHRSGVALIPGGDVLDALIERAFSTSESRRLHVHFTGEARRLRQRAPRPDDEAGSILTEPRMRRLIARILEAAAGAASVVIRVSLDDRSVRARMLGTSVRGSIARTIELCESIVRGFARAGRVRTVVLVTHHAPDDAGLAAALRDAVQRAADRFGTTVGVDLVGYSDSGAVEPIIRSIRRCLDARDA